MYTSILLTLACQTAAIKDEANNAIADTPILAIHPSPGSMALRGEVAVEVVLGGLTQGNIPLVRLDGAGDESWTPQCMLDEEGLWASCYPVDELPYDRDYTISAWVPGKAPRSIEASSFTPEDGHAWLLTEHADVEQFGGDGSTATHMDQLLDGTQLVGVLTEQSEGWWFLAGRADVPERLPVISDPGLTFAIPVDLAQDGRFHGGPVNTFLPIYVDHTTVHTLVLNAKITGWLVDGSARELTITGSVPAAALVRLAAPLGKLSGLLLASVVLDDDTNGDGSPDAAHMEIEINAPATQLAGWAADG
jgi:hypothetical protein